MFSYTEIKSVKNSTILPNSAICFPKLITVYEILQKSTI